LEDISESGYQDVGYQSIRIPGWRISGIRRTGEQENRELRIGKLELRIDSASKPVLSEQKPALN